MNRISDADMPVAIGLFQAFDRCCEGHDAETVMQASVNMVVASINFIQHGSTGGAREGAIRMAREIAAQLPELVASQWDRPSVAKPGMVSDEVAEEFAWLVESFSGQHAKYLVSFQEAYMGHGFSWLPAWTADHMKALRFSRRRDAEEIVSCLSVTSKAKAVEHGWIGAALSPTKSDKEEGV